MIVSGATEGDVRAAFGPGVQTSAWVTVEQDLMDRFAVATRDPDWMHIDPERARREGPFDGTIAFGFWTLSMLTSFLRDTMEAEYPPGVRYGFNYGLDRVRFMAPVPVGSRIRNHLELADVESRGEGRFLVRLHNRVEIEGQSKPAMIADWLLMLVYESGDASGSRVDSEAPGAS